ncbi:MAG TPA: helix-turn-helix domain-containing protein [Solirubrobacteraceae bacterium]|nr:helix-turn-helix domain-containing protein [Solirubrobacteraceae bacterium]
MDPQPELAPPLDGEVGSSGVSELDKAIGGLFWGDNIVFQVVEGATVEPFFRAIAASDVAYERRLVVRLGEESPTFDGFDVIDARPNGRLAQPAPLLHAVFEHCRGAERNLLLFDGLDVMAARWGAELAGRFFATCCPQLLELGAIAYWSMSASSGQAALRRTVEEITQCVFLLDQERLRIAKAEGRRLGVVGSVFRCTEVDGLPMLTPAPMVARIGNALRAARLQRNLSQSDLARIAGVSASAISQAERGQRGLSLETVLGLAPGLDITLDELLRGEVASGYRLGRRRYRSRDRSGERGDPLALLDDRQAGLRAYLVQIPRRGSARPHIGHKGVELVAVASGLVQVLLDTGRPVLTAGETLLLDDTPITGWRNLGVAEATLFWILRDRRRDT